MNILEKIAREKRKELPKIRKKAAKAKNIRKSQRSFKKAVSAKGLNVIAELKRASPSAGSIRKNLNLKETVQAFNKEAAAISILTEKKFFKGKPELIKKVRKISKLPLLRKDFILEESQVIESRLLGADAILLIAALLSREKIDACIKTAKKLGMDCLVEVHNKKELNKVLKTKAEIIGINNRNLKTFKINLKTTARLVKSIPKSKIVVSESGFDKREDTKQLPKQVNAVLVGTSLMKAESVSSKLKELKGKPLVKVCGITNKADALQAVKLGADFLGFNFFPESPRFITPAKAKGIIRSLNGVQTVGVFVNESKASVKKIKNKTHIDLLQFHGDESKNYCKSFKHVIKAFRVKNKESLKRIKNFKTDYVLLDSFRPGVFGGTGKSFDLRLAKKVKGKVFLAGGLNQRNVGKAVRATKPFAVDVCSGIESKPGRKDARKMKAFMERVK
jgi:indole-3-glycerol phosphate synthase/phosphoribosylanthranilate isomerase